MSDRLAEMFARTRAEGRPAVIPFVPGGWPEPDATLDIVRAAVEGGADAMEIGIPFSDPIGDGVTNQVAYQQALDQGVTPPAILDAVRAIRAAGIRVPLLLMGYCNPLLAYGLDRFVHDAAEAGIDGLIVVDLPPDEAGELEPLVRAAGMHMVYMLAPTSDSSRISEVTRHASGFIYCVSVTGVTGARSELSDELPAFLARVRQQTDRPAGDRLRHFGTRACRSSREAGGCSHRRQRIRARGGFGAASRASASCAGIHGGDYRSWG